MAYTSIRLGKRESDLYENVWCLKSHRLVHQIEISKISSIGLNKRYKGKKWSNVMNCKESKWKVSKICNHFLVGGHICSFYNWDRPLDLVLVVYDLIELIIEVSL